MLTTTYLLFYAYSVQASMVSALMVTTVYQLLMLNVVKVVIHVATSMFQYGRPFGSAKRKQARTLERRLLSGNAQFKTFCVQRRLRW